jgi:beta-lactam-binding protein with PASTA domain
MKKSLNQWLQREVTTSQLKDGTFIADYISYGAPALSLVGQTEDEAFAKLYQFLEKKYKPC